MLQAYSVKLPGDTLSPFVLLAYTDNFPAVEFQSIVLTSSIAPEIRTFHLVVAQRRKGNAQKSMTYYFFYFLICLKHGLSFLYWSMLLSKNRTWFISLVPEICLKNRFRVAARLLSNRSQMTLRCGKNKEVAHEPQASVSLIWHMRHMMMSLSRDTWWKLLCKFLPV